MVSSLALVVLEVSLEIPLIAMITGVAFMIFGSCLTSSEPPSDDPQLPPKPSSPSSQNPAPTSSDSSTPANPQPIPMPDPLKEDPEISSDSPSPTSMLSDEAVDKIMDTIPFVSSQTHKVPLPTFSTIISPHPTLNPITLEPLSMVVEKIQMTDCEGTLAAIINGHRVQGSNPADRIVTQKLVPLFQSKISASKDIEKAFKETFQELDDQLLEATGGVTLTIALIFKGSVWTAMIGRGQIAYIPPNLEHFVAIGKQTSLEDEAFRKEASSLEAIVENVNGSFWVADGTPHARLLGGHDLTRFLYADDSVRRKISCLPEITRTKINSSLDSFILIGSPLFWPLAQLSSIKLSLKMRGSSISEVGKSIALTGIAPSQISSDEIQQRPALPTGFILIKTTPDPEVP